MAARPFRFGIVAAWARDAEDWARQARQAEELGYSTLLVPDTLDTLAPFPALAAAASVTSRLHVGSYVLATARRHPAAVAWEAATLDLLSGGRVELGLGAGRPAAEQEGERLGMAFGTPGERLERLVATIGEVRERTPRLPVLVAGSGPRSLGLAARLADSVALGVPPHADEAALATAVAHARDGAPERADELEFNLNLALVGDEVPPWLARQLGDRASTLLDGRAVAALRGTTAQRRDILLRRRDQLGISYLTCGSAFAADLAPVVAQLAGT